MISIVLLISISKAAATYNSTHTQKEMGDLINKINAFVLQNISWIGVPFLDPSANFKNQNPDSTKTVRVLDYACGPGTITAALAGYATEYIGIDLSEKMVEQFNLRFSSPSDKSGSPLLENLNAYAVVGDLLDPKGTPASLSDNKYFNFDLVVVSGGFHHFENVELATERLSERLKPGGIFLIFDFLSHAPNDLHNEPALHTVVHHGFTESRVRELFTGAGLQDVQIKLMDEKVLLRGTAWRHGFMAKGTKASS